MPLTAAEIAKQIDGEVLGEGSMALTGFAPADKARAGDLTFAENQTYFNRAEQSAAAAIMVDGQFSSTKKTIIRVPNARIAFAKVLPLFFPEPTFAPGVHPSAVVAPSAQIDPAAHIGPHCVVGEQTRIEARCVLHGGNHVGANCVLGADTQLFPNVVLYPVTLAGQVGLAGHLKIGNKVTIAAQSGVMHDIPDGEKWFGYPAQPDRQMKRQILAVQQLPELLRRVAELEKKLAEATTHANARKPL